MAGSEEELKNLFMKVKEQSEKAGLKLNIQKLSESEESEVAQLCPALCNPMDCLPPGFSVHGIFQERILEWVGIPFLQG